MNASHSAMFKPLGEEIKEDFIEYEDEQENPCVIPEMEHPTYVQGRTIRQQHDYDRMINVEVTLELNYSL